MEHFSDSGALLLAFLAAGMVDSAIVQNTRYKVRFNLNTVYATRRTRKGRFTILTQAMRRDAMRWDERDAMRCARVGTVHKFTRHPRAGMFDVWA